MSVKKTGNFPVFLFSLNQMYNALVPKTFEQVTSMLEVLLVLFIIIVFLLAFLLLRTLRLHRHEEPVEGVDFAKLEKELIARDLSDTIRCQTISTQNLNEVNWEPWLQLHKVLKKNYPYLHKVLLRKEINHYSLLYTWPGQDQSLKPILLAAHLDVVPAEKDTLSEWKNLPFEGVIKDGFVWGRGALDMKGHLVTILEAVEYLIREGYSPKRTIYLAFGHDEEVYGWHGAVQIAKYLEQKGIKLAAVLDEGGNLIDELFPGMKLPMALVGIGEKGFLTLNISAKGKPGHSSAPPRQTAIGIVARALALIDDHPMQARLDMLKPAMEKVGYGLPLFRQVMLANSWLFKKPLLNWLQKNVQLNAQIRTTSAATMINGGVKDNILPICAQAKVNFRILNGDSIDTVIAHTKKVIADPRVEIKPENQAAWGVSHLSPTDSPAYRTLELAIRQIIGDIPVAPNVFRGGTDGRHYEIICGQVYRFSPFMLAKEDAARIHGIDERVSIETLETMTNFFIRLLRLWGEAEF
jgi:carboxypeptidase PM20D1